MSITWGMATRPIGMVAAICAHSYAGAARLILPGLNALAELFAGGRERAGEMADDANFHLVLSLGLGRSRRQTHSRDCDRNRRDKTSHRILPAFADASGDCFQCVPSLTSPAEICYSFMSG